MPEPEILRRCPQCGAAFRAPAAFCANCGKPLQNATSNKSGKIPEGELKRLDGELNARTTPPAVKASEPTSGAVSASNSRLTTAPGENRSRSEIAADRATGDGVRAKQQSMTAAARSAIGENVVPRVEKLRHASSTILDEATYDPSVRFVLVAVLLFLLFLGLLLLSKFLG